jgi:hypothetical protein
MLMSRPSRTGTIARLALATSCAAATPACTSASKPAPGEVIVVVTTDMAVPADIDTLRWTVTVVGQTTPVKSETHPLTAEGLPGTVAVVSGSHTPGPVLVSLEGLHGGGDAGTVRVHREAQFTVPTMGSKALAMPLDWLCSDANPAMPCASDHTCVAGSCAPSTVDASALPDYAPVDGGACFKTFDCFGPSAIVRETVPVLDSSGRCVLTRDKWAPVVDPANVALVVDTSVAGSYGACAPGDVCLIPLQANSPDGWQTIADDGGITGVVLPDKVCSMGLGVEISVTCPPNVTGVPLCTTAATCAHSDVECPSDWTAYSCATLADGVAAQPTDVDPTQTLCWPAREPGADGGQGPSLLCCHAGPPPAPQDPLLVDDMSGEPIVKIAPPAQGDSQGTWFVTTDDMTSVILPGRGEFFEYTALAPAVATPDGGAIASAACFGVPEAGFPGSLLIAGFTFAMVGPKVVPFDVHPYTGIRFLAWSEFTGQDLRVNFPNLDTTTEVPSTCLVAQGIGSCGDHFGKDLVLTDAPTEYFVRWTDVSQQVYTTSSTGRDSGPYLVPTGFDKTSVLQTDFGIFNFSTTPPTPYPLPIRICIANVYFTQ